MGSFLLFQSFKSNFIKRTSKITFFTPKFKWLLLNSCCTALLSGNSILALTATQQNWLHQAKSSRDSIKTIRLYKKLLKYAENNEQYFL